MQRYTPLLHSQKKHHTSSSRLIQILGSAVLFIFATWLATNMFHSKKVIVLQNTHLLSLEMDAHPHELETKTGYTGGRDGTFTLAEKGFLK